MLNVRILLATTAALGIVAVSGASGAATNAFTATGAPAHVKPSTAASYTIALANDSASAISADKAKIGIPAGFAVSSARASASAAGACVASDWVEDGTLIANGQINLKKPSGGVEKRLCPGATLTVVVSATSAAADGTYTWVAELLRDTEAFVLNGAQPTVNVDGTAPALALTSHPANPSNVTSPSFGFSTSEPASFECGLDAGSFAACASPKSYSNLADGSHTFALRATDRAGNVGTTSYTWLIETTLPIVALTDKPKQQSNSSAATFSFTSSKPASFECNRDGGAFEPCTSPTSYAGLADGPYTFGVRATDAAGNVGPETRHSWAVDTVAPNVAITQKPADPSNNASPSFSFSASEPASFECKLDGAAFAPCASPKEYTAANGTHTFTVRATDAAGNAGEASYSWVIDLVAPAVTITQKPADPTNSRSAIFEFSARDAQSFQCKLDSGAFLDCSSPASYSGLGDGRHTFTVKAADAAGNTGEASYTWLIETTLPIVTLTEKPNQQSRSSVASFSFTASKPSTFECKLDGGAFGSCTSPASYAGLADGAHTFAVRATDAARNVGPETRFAWTIDTVAPAVAITQKPADPTNGRSAGFGFSANEPVSFQCKLDDGPFASCSSPQTSGNLGDGRHTFAVKATDAAGNTGDASYSWTIDTVGPTVALTQKPADPTNSRTATLEFSASEAGATFQCKLDDGAFAACASPHAFGSLADGRHRFVVRAADALENHGPETAYDWTIDARAPAVAVTSAPAALSNSTTASFSFSADEDSTFQCNLDDRGPEPCTSPASYVELREGGHSFVVRATDAAGNVSAASRSWTVDVTAPQTALDSAPPATTSATSAVLTFSASESATFQCRLDGGPFSPCASPVTYAGLATGLHQFAVRAIDAAGNVDATPAASEWTVTTVAVVPKRTAKSALFAPAAGARVTRPPLLRWRAVGGAAYYNVQLYRGSRKVLTAWPTRARLQLSARWTFDGRAQRLEPGVYQWYVWPGYGRATARRYGRLLGTSRFVVGRPATRG